VRVKKNLYLCKKIVNKIMSIFKSKVVLTEQEDSILTVITSMVRSKDCIIDVHPETMGYLLSLDRLQYHLLIDNEGVQLTNHDFFITRRLRGVVMDKIKGVVRAEASSRINARISTIFNNELVLLTKINNKIVDVK
jgi:hypothetical protein